MAEFEVKSGNKADATIAEGTARNNREARYRPNVITLDQTSFGKRDYKNLKNTSNNSEIDDDLLSSFSRRSRRQITLMASKINEKYPNNNDLQHFLERIESHPVKDNIISEVSRIANEENIAEEFEKNGIKGIDCLVSILRRHSVKSHFDIESQTSKTNIQQGGTNRCTAATITDFLGSRDSSLFILIKKEVDLTLNGYFLANDNTSKIPVYDLSQKEKNYDWEKPEMIDIIMQNTLMEALNDDATYDLKHDYSVGTDGRIFSGMFVNHYKNIGKLFPGLEGLTFVGSETCAINEKDLWAGKDTSKLQDKKALLDIVKKEFAKNQGVLIDRYTNIEGHGHHFSWVSNITDEFADVVDPHGKVLHVPIDEFAKMLAYVGTTDPSKQALSIENEVAFSKENYHVYFKDNYTKTVNGKTVTYITAPPNTNNHKLSQDTHTSPIVAAIENAIRTNPDENTRTVKPAPRKVVSDPKLTDAKAVNIKKIEDDLKLAV